MPTLSQMRWLVAAILLAIAAPAAAQGLPAPHSAPTISFTTDTLTIDLPCPPGTAPLVALDDAAPRAVTPAPAPAPPLALAAIVEAGPGMAAPGTPYRTRAADAALLVTALLDRLPRGSHLSLVSFDGVGAHVVLPLTSDRIAARAAADLPPAASPATDQAAHEAPPTDGLPPLGLPATTPALTAALSLARAELDTAPPGPRAALLITATPPDLAPAPTSLQDAIGPSTRLLLVSLAPTTPQQRPDASSTADRPAPPSSSPRDLRPTPPSERAPAHLLAFHTADSAALPGLFATYDARLAELLGTGLTRLRIPAGELTTRPRAVRVLGCGEPITIPVDAPISSWPPLPHVLTGLAILIAAGGIGAWRLRRHTVGARRPTRVKTAPYHPAADVTTARRTTGAPSSSQLRIVVWDGEERRELPLDGRQLTVGRDPGCDIRIESEWVSGLHARITVAGQQLEIVDLGSTNGTFVGDTARPLTAGTAEPLALGVVVQLGPVVRLTVEHLEVQQ